MERSELIERLVPLIPPPRAPLPRHPGALRQLARPGRTGWRCRHHSCRVRARDEWANRPRPDRRSSERAGRARRGRPRSRDLERSGRTAHPGSRRGGPRSRPARHRTERRTSHPPPLGRITPARVRGRSPPVPPLRIDNARNRRHRRPRRRPQDPRMYEAPRTCSSPHVLRRSSPRRRTPQTRERPRTTGTSISPPSMTSRSSPPPASQPLPQPSPPLVPPRSPWPRSPGLPLPAVPQPPGAPQAASHAAPQPPAHPKIIPSRGGVVVPAGALRKTPTRTWCGFPA
jgi:hypothetical protein